MGGVQDVVEVIRRTIQIIIRWEADRVVPDEGLTRVKSILAQDS